MSELEDRAEGQLFAYIGVNAAGSARAICRDDPGEEKSTAKIVSGWIKMGRTIERLPMDEAMRRINASIAEDRERGERTR